MRNPIFWVSDHVLHKPDTEEYKRLNILDGCSIYVDKTKALVTAQLIGTFVFSYTKIRFSHDSPHVFQ